MTLTTKRSAVRGSRLNTSTLPNPALYPILSTKIFIYDSQCLPLMALALTLASAVVGGVMIGMSI